MRPYAFIILFLSYTVLATPSPGWEKGESRDDSKAIGLANPPIAGKSALQAAISSITLLEKRDEIDDWNYINPDNRLSMWYVCPNLRIIATVFNARAVWQAFQRGVWFMQHPDEPRPRWGGSEHPHQFSLVEYNALIVDLGRARGQLYMFPLQPGPLGEWPGLPGAPVSGPPGDHRVIFDEHGMFSGVAVLYTGQPEGTRLIWCYPILEYGPRDAGATAEGNPGVDETLQDNYDGTHYLFAPDPPGGSRPPPRS